MAPVSMEHIKRTIKLYNSPVCNLRQEKKNRSREKEKLSLIRHDCDNLFFIHIAPE